MAAAVRRIKPASWAKPIRLDGADYTVLGILPAGFSELDSGVDVWLPLALDPDDARAANLRYLEVIARLAPGVGIERARSEMADHRRQAGGGQSGFGQGLEAGLGSAPRRKWPAMPSRRC